MVSDGNHLHFIPKALEQSGHTTLLDGVTPSAYTITAEGIEESKRLNEIERL
jgi:hypothetical protein